MKKSWKWDDYGKWLCKEEEDTIMPREISRDEKKGKERDTTLLLEEALRH